MIAHAPSGEGVSVIFVTNVKCAAKHNIKPEVARLILLIVMCALSNAQLCSGNLPPFVYIKFIESKKTQIRVTNISLATELRFYSRGTP